jgi:transcription-repair coupling factor (superfamily II helicase)
VERFKEFPEIEIAMFSRLASDREKKLGLERMAQGFVDVAVGTHALLGENVKFKDLGLLVVDEEQVSGTRDSHRAFCVHLH